MIVFCCPKCKMVDIGNEGDEKLCMKCDVPMLSLGISSSEWNSYDNDRMKMAITDKIAEYNNENTVKQPVWDEEGDIADNIVFFDKPADNVQTDSYEKEEYDDGIRAVRQPIRKVVGFDSNDHSLEDYPQEPQTAKNSHSVNLGLSLTIAFVILVVALMYSSYTSKKQPASNQSQTQQQATSQENSLSAGVDPDLKAFLDDYEEFMDEYIDFMKKYNSDPGNAISMYNETQSMIERAQSFTQKADEYKNKKMSGEDAKYYAEAMLRIQNKYQEAMK